MPQLDRITYMTQIVWLIVGLIMVYMVVIRKIVPGIAMTNKVREGLIEIKKEEKEEKREGKYKQFQEKIRKEIIK